MTTGLYVDAEDCVKEWAAAVVGGQFFLAMPKGSPLPCTVLSRVGGAPTPGEAPDDVARISFECWAKSRVVAKAAALALVSAIDGLNDAPYTSTVGGRIAGAQVVLWLWQPDAQAEISRYIVDADFTVIAH